MSSVMDRIYPNPRAGPDFTENNHAILLDLHTDEIILRHPSAEVLGHAERDVLFRQWG